MKAVYRITYEATVELDLPDNPTSEQIDKACEEVELDKADALWVMSEVITEDGKELASW